MTSRPTANPTDEFTPRTHRTTSINHAARVTPSSPEGVDHGAQTDGPQQLLTIDQLCAWLQVPKHTIYKWRSAGTGPRGCRVGKHVRFDPREVQRWLTAQLEN